MKAMVAGLSVLIEGGKAVAKRENAVTPASSTMAGHRASGGTTVRNRFEAPQNEVSSEKLIPLENDFRDF